MRSARARQGSGRLTPVVPGGRLHRPSAEATIGPVSEIPMYQGGPVDLAELELLAHAASPGPWMSWIEGRDHVAGDSFIETGAEDLYPRVVVDNKKWNPNWRADQDFIAAANPAVILELLRRLRGSSEAD
jgi:hypothetical protein